MIHHMAVPTICELLAATPLGLQLLQYIHFIIIALTINIPPSTTHISHLLPSSLILNKP